MRILCKCINAIKGCLKVVADLGNKDCFILGSETDGGIKPGTTCKNSGCTTVSFFRFTGGISQPLKQIFNPVICCAIFQSYIDESTNDDKCWHHYGVPVFHEG